MPLLTTEQRYVIGRDGYSDNAISECRERLNREAEISEDFYSNEKLYKPENQATSFHLLITKRDRKHSYQNNTCKVSGMLIRKTETLAFERVNSILW